MLIIVVLICCLSAVIENVIQTDKIIKDFVTIAI